MFTVILMGAHPTDLEYRWIPDDNTGILLMLNHPITQVPGERRMGDECERLATRLAELPFSHSD